MSYTESDAWSDAMADATKFKTIPIDDEVAPGVHVCCDAIITAASEDSRAYLFSLDDIYAGAIITDSHGEVHEDIILKDGHWLAQALWPNIQEVAVAKFRAGGSQWDD